LLAQSKAKGYEPQILKNVIDMNVNRPAVIAKNIASEVDKQQTVGILGLSFKPESDDVRDTAAYKIIKELNALGYQNIVAYDPVAIDEFRKHYTDVSVRYEADAKAVYAAADVVAIVTAWKEFKEVPTFGDKKIIDCRYMLSELK